MKSFGYYIGQIPQLGLVPVGWLLLAWPCYRRAWDYHGATSNKVWPHPYEYLNGRRIDTWNWQWLNRWFGNPEDGVSGEEALVWDGNVLVRYNPTGSRWKAWLWSANRNTVDALKYDFPME